jgi:filamentous hemagglutinin
VINGANALAGAGYNVTYQLTASSRGIPNTRTADYNVPGIGQVDEYSPTTTDLCRIAGGIEAKNAQANGVLVQSNLNSAQMQEVANRVWGKPNAQNINTIIFNSNGRITVFTRPK